MNHPPPQGASLLGFAESARQKRRLQSSALHRPLDRVRVLGEPVGEVGHTGCVNALSWAMGGELLLSGGDDTTVRVWRMDSSSIEEDYPWACAAVIHTGHRDNIFNVQMLPSSYRVATVSRDKQVRISDVGSLSGGNQPISEATYFANRANIRVLRCHSRFVKRIATEQSADLFLTVSEDGSVRQHDLRVPHNCRTKACPAPLVQLGHSLSTLALSPLTPYQFVVAGESPYGYLFDRRHAGRRIQEEWGVPLNQGSITTCVRRFGRSSRGSGEIAGLEHVTGARMATENSHEVLLSYSSDAVYLYSTHDSPTLPRPRGIILPPGPRRISSASSHDDSDSQNAMYDSDIEGQDEDDERENGGERTTTPGETAAFATTPIILPRKRYIGHCNVETIKDVNFLGPDDEFVVSGSDDGNVFIWDKTTGDLHDILEGDERVVNVIEAHPHLPLVAVSGIDTTVKLFGPAQQPSRFSRLQHAQDVTARNAEVSSRRVDLTALATYAQIARLLGSTDEEEQPCTSQ